MKLQGTEQEKINFDKVNKNNKKQEIHNKLDESTRRSQRVTKQEGKQTLIKLIRITKEKNNNLDETTRGSQRVTKQEKKLR